MRTKHPLMHSLLLTGLAMLLTACVTNNPPDGYFKKHDLPIPTLDAFPHCRFYGCQAVDKVGLSNEDIRTIKKIFPARDAADERTKIAMAIGAFEKIVGAKTGTDADIRGTYVKTGMYQQDCVDESTNTTTYLMLMNQMGLLKYNTPMMPNSRAPIFSGRLGPHRTAVIKDNATQIRYAVDSWFHDNGANAEIIELDIWKNGWHPPKE